MVPPVPPVQPPAPPTQPIQPAAVAQLNGPTLSLNLQVKAEERCGSTSSYD